MVAYRMTVIQVDDFSALTVLCDDCGSRVTVPLGKSPMPDRCPSCTKLFDDDAKSAIHAFTMFIQHIGRSKLKIEFPIAESVPLTAEAGR